MLSLLGVATAKPVGIERARAVAENLLPGRQWTTESLNGMYVFNALGGQGFVLVAADDCVRPVLGYSPKGTFDAEALPAHVAAWLEGYGREIASLEAAGAVPSAEVQAQWEALPAPKRGSTAVEPMLTTTWNQAPYYNLFCPYDDQDSALSVTGCAATATAQIMKYWNHPSIGCGSEGYNSSFGYLTAQFDTTHYRWNLMPDALTAVTDSVEVAAVAELMYHVGVAIHMNYSASGSGAQIINFGYAGYPSSQTALQNYFRYSPLMRGLMKDQYADAVWDSMLYVEIEAGRPVLYAGFDSAGGHAFVLDGFDSLGFFHVNWGWGGAYDGYYTIDSLSPGAGGIGGNATYTFNVNNQALIGICPAPYTPGSPVTVDVAYDATMGNVEGAGTYVPCSDEVTVVARAREGYRFVRWASGSNANPVEFLAGGDFIDSAIFEPIFGDTLGYCSDEFYQSWQDDWGSTTEWGIRLPSAMRNPFRSLGAAQIFVYAPGSYTFKVYQGDSICANNQLYTQTRYFAALGWNEIVFSEPVPVSHPKDVWLTVSYTGYQFPAAHSRYTGNSDGSWYHLPDGWAPYDQQGVYCTWMLRGVFVEREADSLGIATVEPAAPLISVNGHTVTVDTDEARFFDVMGRQVGSGRRAVMPAAGVYVLRCGTRSYKIIIN